MAVWGGREIRDTHTSVCRRKEDFFPFSLPFLHFSLFPFFAPTIRATKPNRLSPFFFGESPWSHICVYVCSTPVYTCTHNTHNFGILQRQSSRPLQRKGGKNPPKEEIEDSESKWKIFSKDKGEKICMNGWLRKALTDCLFLMSGRWVVNGLSFYILMAFPSYSAR